MDLSELKEHLQGRVPGLRIRIAEMRDVAVSDSVAASAQPVREAEEGSPDTGI